MADFPQGDLALRLEMAFGADLTADQSTWTWTDVSDDLLNQSATKNRGRANESSQVTPTSLKLVLDNRSGDYTPDNPMSEHYPNIVLGTPCRALLQYGGPVLVMSGDAADRVTTPDHASLDITGDIDIRCDVSLESPTTHGELAAKYATLDDERAWFLRIDEAGLPTFRWSPDGTFAAAITVQATLPLPLSTVERLAVRVTLDVDNGASGNTVTFYTADSIAGPWTQLGEPVITAGVTSITASTAQIELGSITGLVGSPVIGTYHAFELRNGIDGTIVADPDFTAQTPGATSFVDSAGRTWTLEGNTEITDWRSRFVGNIDEWLPTWPYGDLSDEDSDEPGESRVDITASGILRRITQGEKALDSTLRRRIPSFSPVAYWPLEEEREATQAYSPISGVAPLAVSGLDFAAVDTLPGSSPLPSVTADASLSGTVPPATAGEWQVELVYNLETMPGTLTPLMQVATSGTARTVRLRVATNQVHFQGLDGDGAEVFLVNITAPDFTGAWNRLQLRMSTNGSTITAVVRWITIGGFGVSASDTFTGSAGRVTQVSSPFGAGLEGLGLGHLAVFDVWTDEPFNSADQAFTGETAAARLVRLCSEEGLPLTVAGIVSDTERMGPQRPGKLMDLLTECATVDGGILGEQRGRSGLRYVSRSSLYNQPPGLVLDAALDEITNPFAPALDDQRTRNDVQVSRTGGSSARLVDEASIARSGKYEEQVTVNAHNDARLEPIAAWRIHLGTWPGMRYPSVSSELSIAPQLIEDWLLVDSGSRAQVVNLPPQHPPGTVDLLVQGYAETLSPRRWTVVANCVPAGPWSQLGVTDDPGTRADTAGSELAVGVDADDTSLSVATTLGPLWTTAGDMPVDIVVGGERMTVTGISGATSPQAFTIGARSVNGIVKAHALGTPVRLAHPTYVAL